MPKRQPQSRSIDAIARRDTLIRHHLEEAATHLGMVKQLLTKNQKSQLQHAALTNLTLIGSALKNLYVRHGGDPRA